MVIIHLYMRMSLKNNLYFNAFNHTIYKINAFKNHRDNNDQGKRLPKSSTAR